MESNLDRARERITAIGERGTDARVEILSALLSSPKALTHLELEERFGHINRVTIYRVLEWLTEKQLAHKISGGDRVWRFTAGHDALHQHAHFQCENCGQVMCLENINLAYAIALPEGFRSTHIEMTIKGECAKCRQQRDSLRRAKPA